MEGGSEESSSLGGPPHSLRLFDIAKREGRPLYAAAPMVRYSKLAFRQTVFDYGVDLCWTPMILAKEFNRNNVARDSDFTLPADPSRIPTIIQFGASSPLEFSRAASLAAPYVSGIDLNCGCPQSWACADNMGAALIHKRELVAEMIKDTKAILTQDGWGTSRTVSVKIRIHKDLRHTVDLIQTIQSAGADFLTIHARTRSQPSSHPASLPALQLLASHATIPVIANGDVVSTTSAHHIASTTGCDGVMAARALLSNPALFAGHESCPWEAVEKFMAYVVRAPIPFKLVVHHLGEMGVSGGQRPQTEAWTSGALFNKRERAELVDCRNMLELMDWLDGIRDSRGL